MIAGYAINSTLILAVASQPEVSTHEFTFQCRALQFAEGGSGHIWDKTFSFPLGLQSM